MCAVNGDGARTHDTSIFMTLEVSASIMTVLFMDAGVVVRVHWMSGCPNELKFTSEHTMHILACHGKTETDFGILSRHECSIE